MQGNFLSEKVQLHISCRKLKDMDFFSKSDPYVKVFFSRDFKVSQPMLLGKTETIANNLNPDFRRTFIVDYLFQSRQDIRFEIMDEDSSNQDDYIGQVMTTLGTIMAAKNQVCILDIKSKDLVTGSLIIRWEKIVQSSQYLLMKFHARKLINTDSFFDFWDKSDPYLRLLKKREDNTFLEVVRTEVVKENLNPEWRPIQVQSSRLMTAGIDSFRIECWDWEEDGRDQYIGTIDVQLNQLIAKNQFPLQIELKNQKEKNPGWLVIDNIAKTVKPSFSDYLAGGLELNVIVAIDFTGSNGIPSHPTSLHYINPRGPNQYQAAINGVIPILLAYDTDKRLPCFGFGGCPRFNGTRSPLSHCFPLSGNPAELQAFGAQHLMTLYQKAILSVELSGPTYFGPIIEETMKLAMVCKNNGSVAYQILLIMTDGQIHDMDKSINLICAAAQLPLSIIIVGVGNADFTNMEKLDGDNGLYDSNGVKARRDIAQFVPFRNVQMNPDMLAAELLAEVPTQIVQYMTLIGKQPGVVVPVNIAPPQTNSAEMKSMFSKGIFDIMSGQK